MRMDVRQAMCGVLAGVLMAWAGRNGAAATGNDQSSTGVMANWKDLETWIRLIQDTRESELGLGLQLSGSAGPMLVSFAGRLDTRSPNAPPKTIAVLASPGLMANPNTLRRPTLRFMLDEGMKSAAVIDATPSLTVDDPAPGAIIHSAATRVPAADFIKLCVAKTLKANVFGSDVQFRLDQIKAMAALAEKLHLSLPKPAAPAAAPAADTPKPAAPAPKTGPVGPEEQ